MNKADSRWRRRRRAYFLFLAGLGLIGAFFLLSGLGYVAAASVPALLGLASLVFSWRQTQSLRSPGGTGDRGVPRAAFMAPGTTAR